MIKGFLRVDPRAWEQAVVEFESARAACDLRKSGDDPSASDVIFDRFQAAEEALLCQPAPDIDAVIEKLLIVWEHELAIVTPDSIPMMAVVGDLRRLAAFSHSDS